MKDFIAKFTRGKFSILFLILFVALLYTVLNNGVMPLVMSIVKSDAFFEKEAEEEQLGKIENKTPRIGYALSHCKDAVKYEGDLSDAAQFLDEKSEAWALGNRHYIIRSTVRIVDQEKGQVDRLFACKVRMIADNEADPNSWSILGVDFNEPSN
ncbi:hypothetical protein SAMN02949497_3731 [Methylomagnum ishizawai]|uniref:Uncharacterized protein n=1 Tax=Methylomagnum ishizawai TaxID=1760988 RepID=A0A1Y6D172_9GAMM|nr:hypothetical protein [Methylomagnum ishizawai]SMF96336.1 hypothetical protein SAMN02949497_3731 [Methylomagnum ishizawai]